MSNYELVVAIEKRDSAYTRICKRAEPLVDGDVTREQAIAKVMMETPQLYEDYLVEEAQVKRAWRGDYVRGNA